MTRLRRKAAQPSTISDKVDPTKIGPMLRDFGFAGSEEDPVECSATWDSSGKPRMVRAHYRGGWRCELRLLKTGGYTLSQSISITIKSKAKGAA